MDIGRIGVWSGQLRAVDRSEVGDAAAAIEGMGYSAMWIPGGAGGDVLDRCASALGATSSLVVATGILNIWRHDPVEVASVTSRLSQDHPDRFLLGLGVSHQRSIGEEYVAPLKKMTTYLDQLDAAGQAPGGRVVAALRRRMLQLARDRSAGSHPYFVPPEHTAEARAVLGAGPLLAPEQAVLLDSDPASARRTARRFCERYLQLPNYTNNLRSLGYGDDDLDLPGSDRLIDAVVAWGSETTIAARVRAHLDAGADHVCIQVIGGEASVLPVESWRSLAAELA